MKLPALALLLSFVLEATTIDAVSSYFRVSASDAPAASPVDVDIVLRDASERPVAAKTVELRVSNPSVEIVQAPRGVSGEAGRYTARIVCREPVAADIRVLADGVEVLENILSNGSFEDGADGVPAGGVYANWYDGSWFGWAEPCFRGHKALRTINFDERKSVYWGFAGLSGDSMPRGHEYIFSIYARYSDIRGERGVSLQLVQRDSAGNVLANRYEGFRAGASDGWRRIDAEPMKLLPECASLSAAGIILCAGGRADFDCARCRLSPTIRWGADAVRRAESSGKPGAALPKVNNSLALKRDLDACEKALKDAVASCGENAPGIAAAREKLAGWQEELLTRVDHERAYELQKMLRRAVAALAALKARGIEAALEAELPAAPPFGPFHRGTAMAKMPACGVVVDGALDEPAWSTAVALTGWTSPVTYRPADNPPEVRMMADNDCLYIGWRMKGAPKICQNGVGNDDGGMFRGETAEMFFGDPSQPMAYRQFAVGPGNQRWDALDGDSFVNFSWQSKAVCSADGWTLEVALPWRELGWDVSRPGVFRMNLARSRRVGENANEASCWSMLKRGYSEIPGFGILVVGDPMAAVSARVSAVQARGAGMHGASAAALAALSAASPAQVVEFQNCLAQAETAVERTRTAASARQLTAQGGDRPALMARPWDEELEVEASPDFQLPLLLDMVRNPKNTALKWRMAVNEFQHQSFLLAALRPTTSIRFTPGPMVARDGAKTISADRIRVYRIGFLRPSPKLWPSNFKRWSGRPLPELVEEVDTPMDMAKFQLMHFRVVIDGTDAAPGDYTGRLDIQADGMAAPLVIPMSCNVMPFALPDSRTNPVWVYIFTHLPYAGDSGRAWAKLLREHYVSDVSFETPRILHNGKTVRVPGHAKYSQKYIQDVTHMPDELKTGTLTVDGEFSQLAERLGICAEFGLKPIFSTRTGDLYPEMLPLVIDFMKAQGLKDGQFMYKTGDEDTSLWQMPLARKIKACAPSTPLFMIPSGQDYFDIRPLAECYSYIGLTRSGLSHPKFEADLRWMQSRGVKLGRYTNRTSWAERDQRLAGRRDLWDVVIDDRMDGYMIWTASVTGAWLNHRFAYSGASRRPVHDFSPEEQSTCQLVYVRKVPGGFKPISSMRLEHMRDGITDVFYYRQVCKALQRRKTANAPEILADLRKMPQKTPADFNRIRERMIELID